MSKNPIMTTKELAEYIKMNEKTVLKMAQSGEIPGVKIGNQWRFRLAVIDKCLQPEMIEFSDEEPDLLTNTTDSIVPLSRLTGYNFIKLNSEAKNIDDILADLVKIAYSSGVTSSESKLLKELKLRESMLSTAVGNGVAIPHPRHPSPMLFKEPKIIIMRSQPGVEYNAPDNKPVHIFFMICAPLESIHLRLLARISKLLHTSKVFDRFMRANDKKQIMQILFEFDRKRMFSGFQNKIAG